MAGGNVLTVTDDSFEQDVMKSAVPVVVDFWATWCGPCQRVAPIMEDLANENVGKVRVGKVDVDENQQIAAQFGVQSIPTVIVFKGGEMVERMVGAYPKRAYQEAIDRHL